jgi:hypothetical protein
MLKRISWRIQPIEHIRKRKQRHKEMLQREKQFADFVMREKKKERSKEHLRELRS